MIYFVFKLVNEIHWKIILLYPETDFKTKLFLWNNDNTVRQHVSLTFEYQRQPRKNIFKIIWQFVKFENLKKQLKKLCSFVSKVAKVSPQPPQLSKI